MERNTIGTRNKPKEKIISIPTPERFRTIKGAEVSSVVLTHRALPLLNKFSIENPIAPPDYVDINPKLLAFVSKIAVHNVSNTADNHINKYIYFEMAFSGTSSGTIRTKYDYTWEGLKQAQEDREWLVKTMVRLYNA